MRITKDSFINTVVKSKPIGFRNMDILLMTNKSFEESSKVKIKITDNDVITIDSLESGLETLMDMLPRRNFLLLLPDIDGFVVEYDFNKILFTIKIHIKYEETMLTFEFSYIRKSIELEVGCSHISMGFSPKLTKEQRQHLGYGLENVNKLGNNYESSESWLFSQVVSIIPQIVYIELSKENLRLKKILPKMKCGDIFKGNNIKNDSSVIIVQVDSLWNIKSIGVGEFKVRGHFRLQPCGVGLSDIKLIFIEEYVKTHYIRKSTREMTFGKDKMVS